jgi:hypothetical protein
MVSEVQQISQDSAQHILYIDLVTYFLQVYKLVIPYVVVESI